ncbi:MAG: NfeD family protein [Pseudomonadales bacterium]|nr:NfeD family protein [Pseudomonadales bacterium]
MEFFSNITAYHWVALALILLTAEMLGASGFLLGAAAAAFGMGALVWLLPDMSVPLQVTIYAIGAIIATVLYFQLFRDAQAHPARPLLNKRAKRLVGHKFKLEEDLDLGTTRIQIGDTMWKVTSEVPLRSGTLVEVVDTNRMSLVIAAS